MGGHALILDSMRGGGLTWRPPPLPLPSGIPQGDLFTVLEASTPDHIKDAMSTILEIEAEAAKLVSMKEGLLDLLGLLKKHKVETVVKGGDDQMWDMCNEAIYGDILKHPN